MRFIFFFLLLVSASAFGQTTTGGTPTIRQANIVASMANVSNTVLYSIPPAGEGMYRVNVYQSLTRSATVSSTLPSVSISYTDAGSGVVHTSIVTPTNIGNSISTTFNQGVYVLYAKAGTNITYIISGYSSTGATSMQYSTRLKLEAL